MLEKQSEHKYSDITTSNPVLDTIFGQVLANQGVLSQ